ncbi:hypothetical protein POEJIIAE_01672 [Mannheimia haemolytica]
MVVQLPKLMSKTLGITGGSWFDKTVGSIDKRNV